MQYWHMNLHPTGHQGTDYDIRNRVLSHTIGMGCDFSPLQEGQFKNDMKIGDIVVVLNGRTPIAVVEVIGDWYIFNCDPASIVWYPLRRAVKILCIKQENGNDCFSGIGYLPKIIPGALGKAMDKNCKTYQYIDSLYKCCTGNDVLSVFA